MRAFRFVLVAALVLAGCGADLDANLTEDLVVPVPTTAEPCWPADGEAFIGGTTELPVTVVTLGEGDRGLVLAPGSGGNYCQWAEQAERLTSQGYRVASFSWEFADPQLSVRAAAAVLYDAGVREYAMLGSSLGAAEVVYAARYFRPAPVAVVSLSPSTVFPPEPGERDYDGPLLVLASTHDFHVTVATSRAVAGPDDRYVEYDGVAHGLAILRNEHAADAQSCIDEFLTAAFG